MAWWDGKFQRIKLDQFLGKYVVLFFWPLDFTFVCPTEIAAFSDAAEEFEKLNVQVIGCSVDSQFTHREYTLKPRSEGGLGPMKVPMVADSLQAIARSYGCLIEDTADDDCGVAMRATYIIDDKGILRQCSVSDLPVGRNVEEVLRLVKAFKYTDEHGEVCPSGWTPGKATMTPDVASKKLADFWANEHG